MTTACLSLEAHFLEKEAPSKPLYEPKKKEKDFDTFEEIRSPFFEHFDELPSFKVPVLSMLLEPKATPGEEKRSLSTWYKPAQTLSPFYVAKAAAFAKHSLCDEKHGKVRSVLAP
ncbi:Hypothetical predicted protein [Podarcis lilfordi]|uniref:Uncharacterized protein n=1 Tax=Podarcis lilfordi TaxID=74358 RepID=A0AA35LHU8_9SAUR|nr:Hypothetical predicted protein [Podarcis lilfordi]